jgi:methyl acetate hydrolase
MSGIDSALRASSANHPTPGFVAAAVRDGELIFEGAFGARDLTGGPRMTLDTVFWIASMSKAITATAAMQQVEAGWLDLEAPIEGVLPVLGRIQVLDGFDAEGTPRLRAPKRPITLRHLLTHTSGFAYDVWNPEALRYLEHSGMPRAASGLKAALETPLMFDPGVDWEYGVGIDWAGLAVEAVSGQTLDAYLADHVLGPLGMTDTAFEPTASMRARKAGMNARTPDGGMVACVLPMATTREYVMGGAGLDSTVGDYLAFLQMILHGGTWNGAQVLKPETVALMSRNHIGETKIRTLTSTSPAVSHDLDMTGGEPAHWGLSWQINPRAGPNGRSAGSLAWAGVANCYYWADPDARVAGVLLTQLMPFEDPHALALFADFERAVYAETAGLRRA